MSGLEERLSRLERIARRQRILAIGKAVLYLVLVAGVIVYLAGLYESRGEWRFELAEPPRMAPATATSLRVEVPVRIYNPSSSVMARLVYYRVYVNGYYAGDGFIPYLDLPHGWSEHVLRAEIDLSRAGCGVAEALYSGENLTVRLEGYAMVDLKVFGRLTWKTVTVPYNVSAASVPPPSLDPASRAVLGLTVYACRNAPTILGLLQALTNASLAPGNTSMPLPLPGGNTSSAPFSVKVEKSLGLSGYTLNITITNTGSDALTIESVKVNGNNILGREIVLGPGQSTSITARTPVLPAIVQVVTDKGSKTLTVLPGG